MSDEDYKCFIEQEDFQNSIKEIIRELQILKEKAVKEKYYPKCECEYCLRLKIVINKSRGVNPTHYNI